jgi:hypothetical protein
MLCGLLYGMWAVVWYVGCCMVCGLLYGMWAIVRYVGCCMVCGLLCDIWALVCHVVCCMIMGCFMLCRLLYFDREIPIILRDYCLLLLVVMGIMFL